MADTDNPYAKYISSAVEAENPYAKYVEKKPEGPTAGEYALDAAKGGGVGLAQGVIGIPGTLGDMQHLLAGGAEKLTGKPLPDTPPYGEAFGNLPAPEGVTEKTMRFPTSHDIQHKVEEYTGPFYQAQYGPGKALQTGAQIAPGLALGGEGLLGATTKGLGAGIGSELAGEGAAAVKDQLPTKIQPYAEPVARVVGSIGGLFGPAAVRKSITPLPVSDERAALIEQLRKESPNTVNSATAGQITNRGPLMGMEGATNKFAPEKQAAKQEEAFTRDTMGKMGVDGLATKENLAKVGDTGKEIGDIRRAGQINNTEFPALNTQISQILRKHQGTVGKADAQVIADVQKDIKLGAANNPTVSTMPGARYDYMRQKVQSAIERAPTGTESKALSDVRQALDDAFHRSIPATQSARLKELESQYAVGNALANKRPTGKDTFTPDEARTAATSNFGNKAVNTERDPLSGSVDRAAQVMQDLPKKDNQGAGSPMTRVMGSILGGVMGGGAGLMHGGNPTESGLVGAILGSGHGGLPDVVSALKGLANRGAASSPSQAYLANQLWRPGAGTNADPATIARLLSAPQAREAVDTR